MMIQYLLAFAFCEAVVKPSEINCGNKLQGSFASANASRLQIYSTVY